ncbi:hypothetical protein, partial [Streptomyces sp. NPDC059742]|uniref:hypothetical protein n=1 Tax=Streptomyces sp. NPDC059742 TaxID=3346927 RepID=UPI00366467D1
TLLACLAVWAAGGGSAGRHHPTPPENSKPGTGRAHGRRNPRATRRARAPQPPRARARAWPVTGRSCCAV